ncbi:M56 family metallopeptidase [Lacticaseibacillus zhaodongensis]|uniref:M56 family metallopeptidase n=1 Tax=Lacticaseibacillus zhaodongensis TaxID=2668065 RepID=UPI0012D2F16B|nr:M56 family metallopeptidase [Lacticaseibacillus zhaodongensis]
MELSVSSVLFSVAVASILIVITDLILLTKASYKTFRVDFLYALIIISALRLIVPIGFLHTKTLTSKHILPVFYEFGHHQLTIAKAAHVSTFRIMAAIWIAGSVVAAFLSLRSLLRSRRLTQTLMATGQRIYPDKIPASVAVYRIRANCTPFVSGARHPVIFLPDLNLSAVERADILQHEYQHIRNHDILQKITMSLLVCAYWWFPLVYLLRKELAIIIELHVDAQVVKNMSAEKGTEYLETLLTTTKKLRNSAPEQTIAFPSTSGFADINHNVLQRRIEFLLEDHQFRSTSLLLIAIIIVLPYAASSVIIEPDYVQPGSEASKTYAITDRSNSYILHTKGFYYLIINGHKLGKVTQLHSPALKGIPIRNKP